MCVSARVDSKFGFAPQRVCVCLINVDGKLVKINSEKREVSAAAFCHFGVYVTTPNGKGQIFFFSPMALTQNCAVISNSGNHPTGRIAYLEI